MKLEYESYEQAKREFNPRERWEVFDRGREQFNIAYECVDRQPKDRAAIRVQFDDGRREIHTFGQLSAMSSQFAGMLEAQGIGEGDRVALILAPSLEFYASFFGTLKRGAVVVPCLPLFGPEAISYRLTNAQVSAVVTTAEKAGVVDESLVKQVILAEGLRDTLRQYSDHYETRTSADTLAIIQFSSGTTGTPRPVLYNHVAATITAVNIKLCIGLRSDDSYFCPSSPAWGHGIMYGTIGPLIFGSAIGAYSGKFDPDTLLGALEHWEVTNMSAIPLVYRTMAPKLDRYRLKLRRMTFTGGSVDMDTIRTFQDRLGAFPQSFYGSTEVGVIVNDYDFPDYVAKPGSMGQPMLGVKVAALDEHDNEIPPGQTGQMAVWRRDAWVRIGDYVMLDEDGYFWHKGRTDDVIKSAGYTIGPFEIEAVLEKHPAVRRAAVVGSPDRERGMVVKAFIVPSTEPGDALVQEIQDFVKTRLSRHEYPREIEFVASLPETPDGKIRRSELRERERLRKLAASS